MTPMLKFLVRPSFQSYRAVARDVSRRGISLYVTRELTVGSRLALYARGRHRGHSCLLTARVVYANRQGVNWLIGCELSRPLSDGELSAFG
jgi:hypothetical protein